MRIAFLLFLLSLCLTAIMVHAQPGANRADLEHRRQSILQSIRESQEQLAETKKNKNATLSQLRALQAKLDARLRLIANLNQEVAAIDGNIQSSTQEVKQLRGNLSALQMRYAQSIRYAYANRTSSTMLAFLFSSKDYNDAMRRLKYLKRYRDYRRQQADEIRGTQQRIEQKIGVLNNVKAQKDQVLTAQEAQRRELQQETTETNNVVKELKGREKQLAADIQKNQKAARQVERAVAAIIAREIEEQRRRAQEEARRAAAEEARRNAGNNTYGGMRVATGNSGREASPPNTGSNTPANSNSRTSGSSVTANVPITRPKHQTSAINLNLTPEAQALSNSFAANRGRLPWPVERGTITGAFGLHKHPVANVMLENKGIDIQTAAGAPVRAVFEGTVRGVFYVGGIGNNVLISHGEYSTVYSNLANVSVHKDQQVTTKQTIGTVGTNDDGMPMVNFQIWKSSAKGSSAINPELWIAR